MTDLHWTEVDHVTTIWVDAPAPLRVGLLFRTGRVDETLAFAGQTHLIEHMALSAMGDITHEHNGFVGGVVTSFSTVGQPEEVSSFLAGICEALTSLPSERLEGEKQILAAEDAARRYDFRSNLLTWRYGAAGYGLIGLPELGFRRATLEQLHEYSAARFTSENAVLWLSGPPPADLRLRLPHGMKQPIPPLTPIRKAFPSWVLDDACGGVAVSATVPRKYVSSIFRVIASRRLYKRLRTTQAVSYAPAVFYDPLDANTAHLVLYADSHKDHRAELVKVFGEVFDELGEVDETDVETARDEILKHRSGVLAPPPTDRAVMDAQLAAMEWILGAEFEPQEVREAQLSAVTPGDVSAFAGDIRETPIFALPSNVALQSCFGKRAPFSSVPIVKGRDAISIDAPIQRERLVYGPDGVSVLFPDGLHFTVRYAELEAALYFDDGAVHLIGSDATTMTVEPTLWRGGQRVCRKIRERVPTHLLVERRSRPAGVIPKPRTTALQRFRARLSKA